MNAITNIILAVFIVAIVVGVIIYIVSEKKKGVKCIGCPSSKTCKSCPSDKPHNDNNCNCNK